MKELDIFHLWQYIDKKKSKIDLIDSEGVVFGHIGKYDSKERAKRVAERIRKIWPSIKFKLIKDRENIDSDQEWFDLYANYYDFYEVITPEILLEIKKRRGKS